MSATEKLKHSLNQLHGIRADYLKDLADEKADALSEALFTIRHGWRWYNLTNDAQVELQWAKIRDDELLLDYVLTGTCRFMAMVHEHDAAWKQLAQQVVISLSWVSADKFIDQAIKERAPKSEWSNAIWEQTPWLLFLYLNSLLPSSK
jgi:hypothetical protein